MVYNYWAYDVPYMFFFFYAGCKLYIYLFFLFMFFYRQIFQEQLLPSARLRQRRLNDSFQTQNGTGVRRSEPAGRSRANISLCWALRLSMALWMVVTATKKETVLRQIIQPQNPRGSKTLRMNPQTNAKKTATANQQANLDLFVNLLRGSFVPMLC